VVKVKHIQITDCPDLLDEPLLTYQLLIDLEVFMFLRKACFNTEQSWV